MLDVIAEAALNNLLVEMRHELRKLLYLPPINAYFWHGESLGNSYPRTKLSEEFSRLIDAGYDTQSALSNAALIYSMRHRTETQSPAYQLICSPFKKGEII